MINKKTYKILNAVFALVVILGATLKIGHITSGGWFVMTFGLLATTIVQAAYIKNLENLKNQ